MFFGFFSLGNSNFTIEDIVEIIIQGKGRQQEIQKSIKGNYLHFAFF